MAFATYVHKADSPPLKRAFSSDIVPNPSFPSKKFEYAFATQPARRTLRPQPSCRVDNPGLRPRSLRSRLPQLPAYSRRSSMPVQASSRTFAPMPSFMSVFGEEVNNTGIRDITERSGPASHGSSIGRPASSGNITSGPNPTSTNFAAFHIHRDSTSTLDSSDSSPTTTISTMDSSSATDPSPGPSPESPVAKVAASSFVADLRSRRTESNALDPSQNTFFELQRPTTPAKKPRNLKNLGINTASSLGNLRINPSASLPVLAKKEKNTSAPTSPSFIKPPTPPKRRPSNLSLTIQTPGSENKPTRLIIPSTPSFSRPALRHFQSSPSLPLCSPSVAPSGGMQLPTLRPIKTNPHGFAEVPIETEEEDQEPNFDVPQSREEKPAAYPHGPICIYESGVFLYFEPTAEQASTYDVIVNVASEVKNPFTSPSSVSQKELDARRQDGPPAETVDFAAIPDRASASSLDTQDSSPTTPKATPVLATTQATEQQIDGTSYKIPEYIHMPWEHNTDIVPDLFKLVKMIDERVQQGKRVLVHCQCGVSRSASLIVAYGLYKNPGISVQEAYDAVKKRSKWIGPNMNLIMQLQEFRNGLLRANGDRAYHNQVYGTNLPAKSAGLRTGVSIATSRQSTFDINPSGTRTPRTAPLPPDMDMSMQRASTGNMISISPGPLSAPSGPMYSPGFRRSWASSQTNFDLSPKASPTAASTPYVDPKGQELPVLSVTETEKVSSYANAGSQDQTAYNEQEVTLKPLPVPNFSRQLPLRQLDASADEVPPTPAPESLGFRLAPQKPIGLAALRSPAAPTFNIPSFRSTEADLDRPSLTSPRTSEFNLPSWHREQDDGSAPSPRSEGPTPLSLPSSVRSQAVESAAVPSRSSELQMNWLNQGDVNGSFEVLSPKAANFPSDPFNERPDGSLQQQEIMSPTSTSFPKDPFVRNDDLVEAELTSPRATEFHMTPLKPRVEDEDPFGLASPRHFEFPRSAFDKPNLTPPRKEDSEARRPSFQAILPPASLAQPPAFNGFASLNGTAQSQPMLSSTPLAQPKPVENDVRVDSLNTSPDPRPDILVEPSTPASGSEARFMSNVTATPERVNLPTPSNKGPRTRFSSPNMREQRKLHKLQTEMEALALPTRPQAADDIDALLSPRANEFTRNPFHVDLGSPDEDHSPASSNATIKAAQDLGDLKEPHQSTPTRAVEEDPRSPVQTGSSPIVRSIFDVL